ncbi:putative mitogen-activated protein kinase [Paratrimastix pyriformis]|uniref:Mitogen-activated protein kinase n=1 Tax=Paratrimastix pyriformis TaxID=342808 RepID=A0ABQ8UGA1_9EUKA|nr:putative mitogen-activated protein kinase [Paratrimastix pyriformis]
MCLCVETYAHAAKSFALGGIWVNGTAPTAPFDIASFAGGSVIDSQFIEELREEVLAKYPQYASIFPAPFPRNGYLRFAFQEIYAFDWVTRQKGLPLEFLINPADVVLPYWPSASSTQDASAETLTRLFKLSAPAFDRCAAWEVRNLGIKIPTRFPLRHGHAPTSFRYDSACTPIAHGRAGRPCDAATGTFDTTRCAFLDCLTGYYKNADGICASIPTSKPPSGMPWWFAIASASCSNIVFLSNLTLEQTVDIPPTFTEFSLSSRDHHHVLCGSTMNTAIFVHSYLTSLRLNDIHFHDCGSNASGGVLRVNLTDWVPSAGQINPAMTVMVNGCTFEGCVAQAGGGSVDITGGPETLRVAVTLQDSTFLGGGGRGGGALRFLAGPGTGSSLHVAGCRFAGLKTDKGLGGGALLTRAVNDLAIHNCTFQDCTSEAGGGGGALAALALAGPGLVNITGAQFAGNTNSHGQAGGGAVFFQLVDTSGGPATTIVIVLRQVNFTGNAVHTESTPTERAYGGAVALAGGNAATAELIVDHCEFVGNRVVVTPAMTSTGSFGGGALHLAGGLANLTLVETRFFNNSAAAVDTTSFRALPGCGGAVCAATGLTRLRVAGCLFTANRLSSGNTGTGSLWGAALYADAIEATLTATEFRANVLEANDRTTADTAGILRLSLNTTTSTSTVGLTPGLSIGQCRFLENQGEGLAITTTGATTPPVHIDGSQFQGNLLHRSLSLLTTTVVGGAAVRFLGVPGARLVVTDTTFAANQVVIAGSFGQALGGAVLIPFVPGHPAAEVSFTGCAFAENVATGGVAEALGGAVAVASVQNLSFAECDFRLNLAQTQGMAAYGGAVLARSPRFLSMSNTNLTGNLVKSSRYGCGGALMVDAQTSDAAAVVNLTGCVVMNNALRVALTEVTPAQCGGALMVNLPAAVLHAEWCLFQNNTITGFRAQGGAVQAPVVVADHCTFTDNSVRGTAVMGGALMVGKSLTLRDSALFGNHVDLAATASLDAPVVGGAVALPPDDYTTELLVEDCVFTANAVAMYPPLNDKRNAMGGSIFGCPRHPVIRRTTFTNSSIWSPDTAEMLSGGAVYLVGEIGGGKGTVVLEHVAMVGCQVSSYTAPPLFSGGAFHVTRFLSLTASHCIFEENGLVSKDALLQATNGGAVNVLTVDHVNFTACRFVGNRIEGGGESHGGALNIFDVLSNTSLTDVTFINNRAAGEGLVQGGAAYVDGGSAFVVTRCTMTGNAASSYNLNVDGGAAFFRGTPRVIDSVFVGNLAETYGGSANGGALHVEGAYPVLERLRFANNTAHGPSFAGGALYVYGVYSLTLRHSVFDGNTGQAETTGSGGAVHLSSTGVTTLQNLTMSRNRVQATLHAEGGALVLTSLLTPLSFILNASQLAFWDNEVRCPGCMSLGGAVFLRALTAATLVDSEFHYWTTKPKMDDEIFNGGGCLYSQVPADTQLQFTNLTFVGCQAKTGGGIMLAAGRLNLNNCSFTLCAAEEGGGAVTATTSEAQLTAEDFVCHKCRAARAAGYCTPSFHRLFTSIIDPFFNIKIFLLFSPYHYHHVRTASCIAATWSSVTLNRANFSYNAADIDAGAIGLFLSNLVAKDLHAFENKAIQGAGGVIQALSSQIEIIGGNFSQNHALKDGGVISSSLSIVNSMDALYALNEAMSGGAWFLFQSQLVSTNDIVFGSMSRYGGVVLATDGLMSFHGSKFAYNIGFASGGGIEASMCTVFVAGCYFRNNTGTLGGALYLDRSNLTVRDTIFWGNTGTDGGVCYSTTDSLWSFTDSDFFHNFADRGGGMYLDNPWLLHTLTGCYFDRNFALTDGSAIFITGNETAIPADLVTLTVTDTIFVGQYSVGLATAASPTSTLTFIRTRVLLNGVEFHNNTDGALRLYQTEAHLGPGCSCVGNVATLQSLTRPVNAWLVAGSVLHVAAPDALVDAETGALWFYPDASSIVALPASVPLLPLLTGTITTREFDRAFLAEITVNVSSPARLSNFEAVCFVREVATGLVAKTSLFTVRDYNLPVGSCDATMLKADVQYELVLSNDGGIQNNVTVGFFTVKISMTAAYVAASAAGVSSLVAVLLVLGLIILARWLRLKRATNIELASWRTYQVAAVDFTNLKIEQRIGHGAAGEVFRGNLNGTAVAVKRLFDTAQTEAQMADFKREVAMMRTLRHPFIVSLIGATFENPKLIITEYMGRGSLYTLLHNPAVVLSPQLRLRMAFDMARGLNYLHTLRPPILHRDIKSQNMLVTDDMRVKVSDFGISRLSQEAGITTAAGTPGLARRAILVAIRCLLVWESRSINNNVAKEVFEKVFAENIDPLQYVEEDGGELQTLCLDVLPLRHVTPPGIPPDPGVRPSPPHQQHRAGPCPTTPQAPQTQAPGGPLGALRTGMGVFSIQGARAGFLLTPFTTSNMQTPVSHGPPPHPPPKVVLWELVTRQTPWDGVPPLRVMLTVAQEGARLPAPPPEDPNCLPIMRELMQSCWAEKAEDRPTMQQIVDRLMPHVDTAETGVPDALTAAAAAIYAGDCISSHRDSHLITRHSNPITTPTGTFQRVQTEIQIDERSRKKKVNNDKET